MPKTQKQLAYAELLKSPLWKERRDQVLQSHGAECDECQRTDDLEVHHSYYTPGLLPWEYADDCFVVLCEEHHKKWHEARKRIDKYLQKLTVSSLEDVAIILEWSDSDKMSNIARIIVDEMIK